MKTFFKPLRPASFFLFVIFMAGILSGDNGPDGKIFIFPIICFLIVFLCLSLYSYKQFSFFLFLGLVFCCGYLSIQTRLTSDLPPHHISNYLETKKIKIHGRIGSFKKHYKNKYSVVVWVQSIEPNDHTKKKVEGKIILNIYGLSKKVPEFGDLILFESSIKSIKNFMNPGAFNYKRFLKLKGIYGTAYSNPKKLKILTQPDQINVYLKLIRKIERLRTGYYDFILTHAKDTKTARLIVSLVTGKKEIISPDMRDLFSKAGISHLLAISGLHLSIVSLIFFIFFYQVLSFFPGLANSGKSKKIAGLLSLFPLVGYAVFSGFSPSTQRALIMIIVVLFSFVSEREKDIVSSLSAAGIIILVVDPAALFSISFQLSFTAVVFIVSGVSLLNRHFTIQKTTLTGRMGLMACITLFASLGTFPLTAHYFNIVSIIALISNFVFIPIIGFIVLPMGLLSFVCFSNFPLLAIFIINTAVQILLVSDMVLNLMVSIPFSWSRITTLQWNEIAAIYSIFILFFLGLKGNKKILISIPAILLLWAVFNFSIHRAQKSQNLKITILDVGQGNSAFIQTPEGENILVDGGGFSDSSSFDTGRFILAPFLWQKGITSLDYVILTHPEADHLNGLIFILNNFDVQAVIKNNDHKKSEPYVKLMSTCEQKKIRIWNPSNREAQLDSGSVKLIFYSSAKEKYAYDYNNNSLVFRLIYQKFSILFPGDILSVREKNLSRNTEINLCSDILLAPHHGSSTSSTKVFLDKVKPRTAIISCGRGNRYRFPHGQTLKRYEKMGVNLFRTDKDGAIFIESDGHHYKIASFVPGKSHTDIF